MRHHIPNGFSADLCGWLRFNQQAFRLANYWSRRSWISGCFPLLIRTLRNMHVSQPFCEKLLGVILTPSRNLVKVIL